MNDLKITESGKISELRMVSLDVDVASDFFDGGEQVKPGGIHGRIARTKGEVLVDLLKPIECAVKDSQASLNDSTILEALNVARVYDVTEMAGLWTSTVTGNTFSNHSLQIYYDQVTSSKFTSALW